MQPYFSIYILDIDSATRGRTVRAPIYAPVIDLRYPYVLVMVAYRTLGYSSSPELFPTHIAKALLHGAA